MTAWASYMQTQAPRAEYNIYLDDRLLFVTTAENLVEQLNHAAEVNETFESNYGLVDHADKWGYFASRPWLKRQWAASTESTVAKHVESLGIKHLLNGQMGFMDTRKRVAEAIRRSHRILLGGGPLRVRAEFVPWCFLSVRGQGLGCCW